MRGGSATHAPAMPSTIPIQATVRKPCGMRRFTVCGASGAAAGCGAVVTWPPAFAAERDGEA